MSSSLVQILTRKLALVAVIGVVTAAAIVAAARPAYADVYVYWGNDSGGFLDYGEHLNACDGTRDGYRVLLYYWRADTNTTGVLINANGAGTCTHRNLAVPEGESIRIRLCHQNGPNGSVFSCTGWAYDNA